MNELISIDKLIKTAKSKGVNFGSGDPYNRLRYYTKIGWLPHMVRKSDKNGNIKGHYPTSCVDKLVLIEDLKSQGLSNEEISNKIRKRSRFQDFLEILSSPEVKKQIILYLILVILLLIFANELSIINLGSSKSVSVGELSKSTQIYQDGTSFVPKNQNKVFITSNEIRSNSKVYVTFTQDFTPASRYWVSDVRDQKGFLLELDAPVSNNVEFYWWLSY